MIMLLQCGGILWNDSELGIDSNGKLCEYGIEETFTLEKDAKFLSLSKSSIYYK